MSVEGTSFGSNRALRRRWLRALTLVGAPQVPGASLAGSDPSASRFAPVVPGQPLSFPRDHGAHPEFRIEWWYLTGWLDTHSVQGIGPSIGVQITFFRVATGHQRHHQSQFAARQLLFAHAALAVPGRHRLQSAERAARTGWGLAEASESDTGIVLGDWRLQRNQGDRYIATIVDSKLSIELSLKANAPPLLQGDQGFSRKGPSPSQASYYYSRPRLAAEGRIRLGAEQSPRPDPAWSPVRGSVWFDHEWSSELLDPDAQGWDWVGLHIDDGSALMAFRIRRRGGGEIWCDANWVDARGRPLLPSSARESVQFETLRQWRSPRTGAQWPVAQRLRVGTRVLELEPLLDNQELETRGSTGVTYWEGAVVVTEGGRQVGRGYLELTGYAQAMRI